MMRVTLAAHDHLFRNPRDADAFLSQPSAEKRLFIVKAGKLQLGLLIA